MATGGERIRAQHVEIGRTAVVVVMVHGWCGIVFLVGMTVVHGGRQNLCTRRDDQSMMLEIAPLKRKS